jgi:hypothetical protein
VVRYSRELVVPVTLDDAFAYLSRFSSAQEWDPSVRAASMLTPEPVGLGSAFLLDVAFLGRQVSLRYDITEFDRPGKVTLTAENAAVRSVDTITFHPQGPSTTLLRYDADLALLGAARLAAPLFAVAFRRVGNRAADGLRTALSARATRQPDPDR